MKIALTVVSLTFGAIVLFIKVCAGFLYDFNRKSCHNLLYDIMMTSLLCNALNSRHIAGNS